MRLVKRSKLRKLIALGRYVYSRCWHFGNIHGSWRGFMDTGCAIYMLGRDSTMVCGDNLTLGRGSELQCRGILTLGDGVFANRGVRVIAVERITIGDRCLFGPYVSILDHDHDIEQRDKLVTMPVTIGNNVWIGEKAVVLKGVTIGDNSIVGAASVVTRCIPANVVAAGNPATIIKRLDEPRKN